MKAHKNWSYEHYSPIFWNDGDIYICRVAPSVDSITFEWKGESREYRIYCRVRNEGIFEEVGRTYDTAYTITGLTEGCEYEFCVMSGDEKSRVRLARCGDCFGTPVNYLHPEDEVYSFSGRYLCSPSLVRHPDGYLLASMDLFAGDHPQNLTLIFRSDDEGKTWHHVSEVFPCFWGKLFIYNNELYLTGCSTEYGDLLLGKSTDGGKTFGEPTVLLRGSNGKNGEVGVHKNPQPVVEYKGRIWNTFEWGSWDRGYHAVAVMSAPLGCDLLDADNWAFSYPVKYEEKWLPEFASDFAANDSTGCIEGSLVVHEGKLYNIMRFDMTKMRPNYGYALVFEVNTDDPEAPLKFVRAMEFPANHAKFTIKYDERTKLYLTIANRLLPEISNRMRTIQSLMYSKDLVKWEVLTDLIDHRHIDPTTEGFQYTDFIIEGSKILYLTRTATAGAKNHHDSNYSVFKTVDIDKFLK